MTLLPIQTIVAVLAAWFVFDITKIEIPFYVLMMIIRLLFGVIAITPGASKLHRMLIGTVVVLSTSDWIVCPLKRVAPTVPLIRFMR
jgi:antibiotic biosynthesis monooxygenase (ABM) superfamily enzyme